MDLVSHKINPKFSVGDFQFLNSFPIEISRSFNAPIGRIWKSWCSPEMMKQWFGPEKYTCPVANIKFEEGGKYHNAMEDQNGNLMWSTGFYKEITPFQKIVMLDAFSDAEGNVVPANQVGAPGDWEDYCTVTVEFTSTPADGTMMTLKHDGIPAEMRDECKRGWEQSFNKLQKLVEGN